MTDYMLTVIGAEPRDVQVNGCADIREAIEIAERVTHFRVDHGRGGVLPLFDPAIIIDAPTGEIIRRHDKPATQSMEIVNHARERGVIIKRGS